MANVLSQVNIVDGQIVEAHHISQSINAFTGAIGYDVTFSGSFTLTGATTGSGFWQNAVSSSFAYSSSVTVSSSYAPTLGSFFASGSALVTNTSLNFIAGAGKTTGGILGVNLPELSGKTLGQNVFVSLALSSSAGTGPLIQVGDLNTGVLTFTSFGGNPDFFYTIIYI